MDNDKALIPVDQRDIDFYGDMVTAVIAHDGTVYIPIRPICQNLGVSWPSQSNRISRDPILSEVKGVFIVNTPGGTDDSSQSCEEPDEGSLSCPVLNQRWGL
ncbi:MAG: hypothetical protein IAE79_00605 [Anaerolinea sp.]|nr:hypothetical protein [Anaerolinea sp.]